MTNGDQCDKRRCNGKVASGWLDTAPHSRGRTLWLCYECVERIAGEGGSITDKVRGWCDQ